MADEFLTIRVGGLEEFIKDFDKFVAIVDGKAKELLDLMLKEGENYAINSMGHFDTGETLTTIGYRNTGKRKGVIVADGAAIWIEFGTGVGRNGGNSHPAVIESSVPIYPHGGYGKGKGKNPNGWYYYDENHNLHHTRGIRGNQFMYNTVKMLYDNFPELAKEVFSE